MILSSRSGSTHCDHECVCNWLACNVNCENLDDPCGRKNCEHDTRTHVPSTPPHCRICDDCGHCTKQPYFVCSEYIRIEKSALVAQARAEVLDELDAFIESESMFVVDSSNGVFIRSNDLIRKIKSLRLEMVK